MTIRQTLEQEEHRRLDPRAAFSDQSRGRPIPEPEREDDVRTCFQRDTDRIVHSKSFRRLMHKTQVFLRPEGDHYRTHDTYPGVARIARTITRALRLNEDLTEAIALGHDLGHTPLVTPERTPSVRSWESPSGTTAIPPGGGYFGERRPGAEPLP